MKRFLALFLSLLLLFGLFTTLASCDIVDPETNEKVTLPQIEKETGKHNDKNDKENDESNIIIPGKDGITPKLRINPATNEWEISYDYGKTWESTGVKATPEANVADTNEYGLDFYPLPDGTYGVKGGKSIYLTKVVIPDSYNGKPVTKILDEAFMDAENLTEIVIPDIVISIEECAFQNCRNLEKINLPKNLTKICHNAFYCCSKIKSITLPSTVTQIGDGAFSDCYELTEIKLSDNLTSIGNRAFYCCFKVTDITIGSNVTYIGKYAFEECSGLKSVEFKIAEGWNLHPDHNSSALENIRVTAEDLSDKATAAKLLTFSYELDRMGYCSFIWKRS